MTRMTRINVGIEWTRPKIRFIRVIRGKFLLLSVLSYVQPELMKGSG